MLKRRHKNIAAIEGINYMNRRNNKTSFRKFAYIEMKIIQLFIIKFIELNPKHMKYDRIFYKIKWANMNRKCL